MLGSRSCTVTLKDGTVFATLADVRPDWSSPTNKRRP